MSSTNVNNNKQTGILILGKQKTTFEIFVLTIRYNNTKRKALKTTFGVVVFSNYFKSTQGLGYNTLFIYNNLKLGGRGLYSVVQNLTIGFPWRDHVDL